MKDGPNIVGIAALVPLLIPSLPYKKWNALFLLVPYPLMTFILLTGGHLGISLNGLLASGPIVNALASDDQVPSIQRLKRALVTLGLEPAEAEICEANVREGRVFISFASTEAG